MTKGLDFNHFKKAKMAPADGFSPTMSMPMLSVSHMYTTNETTVGGWSLLQAPADSLGMDLFMIVFASSFLLVAAAVLRLAPWANPAVTPVHWTARRGLLLSASEADSLRAYVPFSYGAMPPSTHAMATTSHAINNNINFGAAHQSYETLLEIGDLLGTVKRGLTDEQIRVLPSYRNISRSADKEDDRVVCAICREEPSDLDLIRVLPCGDEFHADCISPWLKQQATCPLCRSHFA